MKPLEQAVCRSPVGRLVDCQVRILETYTCLGTDRCGLFDRAPLAKLAARMGCVEPVVRSGQPYQIGNFVGICKARGYITEAGREPECSLLEALGEETPHPSEILLRNQRRRAYSCCDTKCAMTDQGRHVDRQPRLLHDRCESLQIAPIERGVDPPDHPQQIR